MSKRIGWDKGSHSSLQLSLWDRAVKYCLILLYFSVSLLFIVITSQKQLVCYVNQLNRGETGRCFTVSINRNNRLSGCCASLRTHHDGKPSVRVACTAPTPQPTWKTKCLLSTKRTAHPEFRPEPSNCCALSFHICKSQCPCRSQRTFSFL